MRTAPVRGTYGCDCWTASASASTREPRIAADRLICSSILAEAVETDGASAALATASTTLIAAAASEVGLWEAGPGTDTDIEIDEVFLVLSGAGTVTFDDGSSLVLQPGVVVRLVAGDRTAWAITDRLRKLYLA